MDRLVYDLAVSSDGTDKIIDMDVPGWMAGLTGATRLTLVPKHGVVAEDGLPFQPVSVPIPDGATPIALSRVKAWMAMSGSRGAKIRIHGVGYEKDGRKIIAWVLPNGSIEIGEDSPMADEYLRALVAAGPGNG